MGKYGLLSTETSASCVMVCRAGTEEWILLQSAVAPIPVPSTFHSCCSYWWLALAGCHAFLPQCSGEHLRSHKHNLVHSELLPSLLFCLSSTTHVNHKLYFIFGWHPCLSPALCSDLFFPCAWSLWGSSSAALHFLFCSLHLLSTVWKEGQH